MAFSLFFHMHIWTAWIASTRHSNQTLIYWKQAVQARHFTHVESIENREELKKKLVSRKTSKKPHSFDLLSAPNYVEYNYSQTPIKRSPIKRPPLLNDRGYLFGRPDECSAIVFTPIKRPPGI